MYHKADKHPQFQVLRYPTELGGNSGDHNGRCLYGFPYLRLQPGKKFPAIYQFHG